MSKITAAAARNELARRTQPKGSALRTPPAKTTPPTPAYLAFQADGPTLKALAGKAPAAKAPAAAPAPKPAPEKAPKSPASLAFDAAFAAAPEGYKRAAAGAAYGAILRGDTLKQAMEAGRTTVAKRIAAKNA